MNGRLASRVPTRLRAFCASTSALRANRPDYLTPQQILEDPAIQNLLRQSNLTSTSPISDPRIKLSILSHLSEKCNVPVASNAFLTMSTPGCIAMWYSAQLKPCKARPHARNLIRHTLGDGGDGGDGGDSEEMENRIDLEREAVQEELEAKIPSNVVLDERTFLKVDETWVRKRKFPKPQLGKQ